MMYAKQRYTDLGKAHDASEKELLGPWQIVRVSQQLDQAR